MTTDEAIEARNRHPASAGADFNEWGGQAASAGAPLLCHQAAHLQRLYKASRARLRILPTSSIAAARHIFPDDDDTSAHSLCGTHAALIAFALP
jgi:hypothetical protein